MSSVPKLSMAKYKMRNFFDKITWTLSAHKSKHSFFSRQVDLLAIREEGNTPKRTYGDIFSLFTMEEDQYRYRLHAI